MRWTEEPGLRSGTAVAIVFGLLIVVVVAYWGRGFDEAQRVFGLLQGLILGAFGWLYGSQGTDRAEAIAAAAEAARAAVARQAESAEARIARLEQDAQVAQRLLAAALSVPGVEARVKAGLGELEEGGDDG